MSDGGTEAEATAGSMFGLGGFDPEDMGLDDLDLDLGRLGEGDLLGPGSGQPMVGDWFLPLPQPQPGASHQEVAEWVISREDFVASAPMILTHYMAIVQGAIDAWDADLLGLVLPELGDYLRFVQDHIKPLGGRGGVSEVLGLERGLALARELDPAKLHGATEESELLVSALLQDIAGVLALCWRNGVPQLDGARTRASFVLGQRDLNAGVLQEMGRELHRWLHETADAAEAVTDPLLPDVPQFLSERIARPGRTPISLGEIPDRDVFYEFLAHRYAYTPDTPGFAATIRANGYCHGSSYRFETKSGLGFIILMPSKERGGALPPVFVFRGTEIDDLNDIRTDLELQIGAAHFDAVKAVGLRALLRGAAADCDGTLPHLTGHSLGGCLAQLAAAEWPELVDVVVTFQAPGLSKRNHRFYRENLRAGHTLDVTHYIADEDVVHLAGQKHLDGTTILATGLRLEGGQGIAWGLGHTQLLLFGHGMRDRLIDMRLASHWCPHQLGSYARLAEHPSTAGSAHEIVRSSLSVVLSMGRRFAAGDRAPGAIVGNLRQLMAEGLDQSRASLSRSAVTLLGLSARASLTSVGSIRWVVRKRYLESRVGKDCIPEALMEQYEAATRS